MVVTVVTDLVPAKTILESLEKTVARIMFKEEAAVAKAMLEILVLEAVMERKPAQTTKERSATIPVHLTKLAKTTRTTFLTTVPALQPSRLVTVIPPLKNLLPM